MSEIIQDKRRKRAALFKKHFLRDWQLYLLIVIPTIPFFILTYGPMYGIQIAFRDYRPLGGVTGSVWVGLKWFKDFLADPAFLKIFGNTLILSLYSLVVSFPFSIILALLFNAMTSKRYRTVVQTISYMPYFISTTVFVAMIDMLLSPVSGIYGNLYRLFGGNGYPVDFAATSAAFRHIYIWSGIWQDVGWGSILYTSALSAVSMELHEAAKIDGASRFKRVLYVDIPAIIPTITIMLIMRVGSIISVGFEKAYLMQTGLNTKTSEVISTYVYKRGMSSFRNFSYGSAVGLFETLINLTLVLIVNYLSKKASDGEVSLF